MSLDELNKQAHNDSYKGRAIPRISFYESLVNEKGQNGYEAILNAAHDISDKNIIDLGCGTGNLLNYMKEKSVPKNYVGVDLSEVAISKARGFYPSFSNCFYISNLGELNFPKNTFDTAFSHMVLALVTDVEVAVSEIERVLKPGGSIHIFTPAYWRLEAGKESKKFLSCMDKLNSISPNPDTVGIGNQLFRERESIENLIDKAFSSRCKIQFQESDFVIAQKPLEVLQIFSAGMYQFMLIPDSEKGEALKTMFEFILSLQDLDGIVRMSRPMEIISIQKNAS